MDFENEKINDFIKRCQADIITIQKRIEQNIKKQEIQFLSLNCYKYTMCKEMLDLFNANKGGLGYYVKALENEEQPLLKIFDEMLSNFTEKNLVKENDLFKLLDKKKWGR